MKIIEPSFEIVPEDALEAADRMLKVIEAAGRTCYKSEDKITEHSARPFVRKIAKVLKHESVIEHAVVTVRFIVDRGVSHELVRHRIASFSQESTRYVHSCAKQKCTIVTEDDVLQEYEAGATMLRIATLSDGKYSEHDVRNILDNNGVCRRPKGNTGPIFEDFFDVIDTPEKAYLLGFIQADGSVRKDGSPQVSIAQHKDNSWYVSRMVRNLIRPSARRVSDKQCHSVTFTSDRLRDALIAKGVVPNKSYEQTDANIDALWRSLPSALVSSFLRGLLDGDGCVRFFTQSNAGATDSCRIEWNCHRRLAEHIQTWLVDNFSYNAKVKPHANTKQLHHIYVTQPEVGERVVKAMLADFVFPYGHPVKTSRMISRVGGVYPVAEWGDPSFKVIKPCFFFYPLVSEAWIWAEAVDASEDAYTALITKGASPQQARSVLPNSLKTEVVMTCNLRQWRHVFAMRTAANAHPQMRQVMIPLAQRFHNLIPEIYDAPPKL